MEEVNFESHNMGPTFYWLTSLSFHGNRPYNSQHKTFSKFDLENPRSRSWVRGKLKVTTWVQHSIVSHSFHSMSSGHSIPEIRLFFKILIWKYKVKVMVEVKVESHKVGATSYRLTSLSSQINRPPIPEIQHYQNLNLKIQGQGHGWGGHWKSRHGSNILWTHIPLIPCQSVTPFLGCDFFKNWPWKSKVKVMGEGKFESHKVGVASYRLASLSSHVNRPFHSWDTAFSKFDLENPRSRSNYHDVAQLQV